MSKYRVEKVANVYMSIDSSELIMFNKGGSQKIEITASEFDGIDKVILFVQMERNDQSRYDWITSEAEKHSQQFSKPNSSEES